MLVQPNVKISLKYNNEHHIKTSKWFKRGWT